MSDPNEHLGRSSAIQEETFLCIWTPNSQISQCVRNNLTGRNSFLPCFRGQNCAQLLCKGRCLACCMNVSMSMRQRETNIWMLSSDEQIVASVYPTPQGGAGTQVDQMSLSLVYFCSDVFFSTIASPPVGFGGGGRVRNAVWPLRCWGRSGRSNEQCGEWGGISLNLSKILSKYSESNSPLGKREYNLEQRRGVDEVPYVHSVTSTAVYSSWKDGSRRKAWFRSHQLFSFLEPKHPLGKRRRWWAGALRGWSDRTWCTVLDDAISPSSKQGVVSASQNVSILFFVDLIVGCFGLPDTSFP